MPARIFLATPILVLASALAALAQSFHFVPKDAVDPVRILAEPPVASSEEANAELEWMLMIQQCRTNCQTQRCNAEVNLTMAAYQSVIGPWLTAENLPLLQQFFNDVEEDSMFFSNAAKKHFARKRPYEVDSRIQPCVTREATSSYPSGHATRGLLFATILAELAPDCRASLLLRGQEIGWDRVVAGVHFPSDISAGRTLARALTQALLSNPQFQAELARVKVQFEEVRQRLTAKSQRAA